VIKEVIDRLGVNMLQCATSDSAFQALRNEFEQ